jgi:hypothetical protein
MVNPWAATADTPDMDEPDALHRRRVRDRLVNRVTVMGQLSALVAMASTGVTAGVLAHDAQRKDQQAAQAAAAVPPSPAPPAVARLVPKPIRTVLVRVPAPARKALPRKANTAPVVRRTVTQAAPRQVVRAAPKAAAPAPRRTAKPAATTTSGS